MDYSTVAAELGRLQRIAQGWVAAGKIDAIERDLVLHRLKELYEQVLFAEATVRGGSPYVKRPAVALGADEEIEELNVAAAPETGGPNAAETATRETVPEAEVFDARGEEPEFTVEELSAAVTEPDSTVGRQSVEEPAKRQALDKRVIRSLYDGDTGVLNSSATDEASASVRWSLSVSDRCLIIRDLFGGDAVECDSALEELDKAGDMNAALIYIADRYDWDPDSDGARILVRLLKSRFE